MAGCCRVWMLVVVVVVAVVLGEGGGRCQAGQMKHLPPLHDRPVLFNQELEEFADLSEADAKLHLMNLFASMDTGLDHEGEPVGGAGDGVISPGELAIRLTRVEFDRQSLDAVHHILEVDMDDDGLLSWAEVKQITPQYSLRDDAALERFKQADKNHDGWLSETEVEGFFHPETQEHMFPLLAREVFRALDLNGDRKLEPSEVSLDALEGCVGGLDHIPAKLARVSSLFRTLDADTDGFIDMRELQEFFEMEHRSRIFSLADAIIAAADLNRDRKLDSEEVWRAHEQFIGGHGEHHGGHLRDEL